MKRRLLLPLIVAVLLVSPFGSGEPESPGEGGSGYSQCWECATGTAEFPSGNTQPYSFCLGLPSGGYDECWANAEGAGCFLLFPCWRSL